ncbi:MAG: ABC transporter ATP-binding protein [Chloroflexi bacterium]|nr:ABC transporter ATP-binding protein [Chloroflexota bacterium]
MSPILQVRNLVTRFDTVDGIVHAVNGVSFDLEEGETLAIVGESGCGKTVTVLSLLRLIPEPPGRIESGEAMLYEGAARRDLLKLSEPEMRHIRGGRIGFIFQDPMTSLNPVLTIGEQIAESLVEHLGMDRDQACEHTIKLLARVGIPDPEKRYSNYPHQFSGGMRQRAMIAIAIACTPEILIADEPTTALDVTVQAQIVDLVKHLRTELGMAVIWITHDLGVVAGLADWVQVMYGGMVVERAFVDYLYERPQHPYTIGLLGALPGLDRKGTRRLVSIEGTPPELMRPPSHCQFAPRCSYAFDRCWQEIPPLLPVGVRHEVACFFNVEKGRPW